MYPTLKLIVEYLGTYVSIFFFLGRGCLFFLKFSKVSLRMRQTHDENNSHTQRMVVFLRSQVFWLEVKIESSFLNSVLCLLKRLQVPGYMGVKSHNRIIHTSTPKKSPSKYSCWLIYLPLLNLPTNVSSVTYWFSIRVCFGPLHSHPALIICPGLWCTDRLLVCKGTEQMEQMASCIHPVLYLSVRENGRVGRSAFFYLIYVLAVALLFAVLFFSSYWKESHMHIQRQDFMHNLPLSSHSFDPSWAFYRNVYVLTTIKESQS